MELFEALKTIRAECDKHWECETCPLYTILCETDYHPCNWSMNEIEKELK